VDEFPILAGLNSGSVFFIGLGLTFLLVALLPNPAGQMQWAYIPAVVLFLLGAFLGNQDAVCWAAYFWPVALIVAGILVVVGFFIKKE
jgi:hypothetical protein